MCIVDLGSHLVVLRLLLELSSWDHVVLGVEHRGFQQSKHLLLPIALWFFLGQQLDSEWGCPQLSRPWRLFKHQLKLEIVVRSLSDSIEFSIGHTCG